jgi:hypothetical protein
MKSLSLLFIVFSLAVFGQDKSKILGNWVIYKVDIGEICIDQDKETIEKSFTDKYRGLRDSALSVNMVVGTLKNLIGTEYNFRSDNTFSQFNHNSRKIKEGEYKYVAKSIWATISNTKQEYLVLNCENDKLVLQLEVSVTVKAKVTMRRL